MRSQEQIDSKNKKLKHRQCTKRDRRVLFLTCEADCLLDDDPDVFCACMAEVCLRYSTSLKTFLSPPPALCRTLSSEPTFPFSTFTSTFSFRICKRCGAHARRRSVSKCAR